MTKFSLSALALWLVLSPAYGQHAHSHGAGRIGVVVENDQLTIMLEIPQHDLVGFERAPRNDSEQGAVQTAMDKLDAPERLFVPSAAAQCKVADKKIDAPLLSGRKSQDGHGDVTARYVYRCARPGSLSDLEIRRVHTLAVSFSGSKGQKAGKIDPKNTVFSW